MPSCAAKFGLLPIRSRTDRTTLSEGNGFDRRTMARAMPRGRHGRRTPGGSSAHGRVLLPVSPGRARLPRIGLIALLTEVGEIPSCSEPLTAAKAAEALELGGAAFVVADDLVEIEYVYVANIEFREPIPDVVEKKTELLVVIGRDRLPGCTPLRLLVAGV